MPLSFETSFIATHDDDDARARTRDDQRTASFDALLAILSQQLSFN
jgi:hypothetical protein